MAQTYDLDADTVATPPAASLREDAYDRATRQARDFLSGGDRSDLDIRARLDELIAEARRELATGRVAADDIEGLGHVFPRHVPAARLAPCMTP